MASKPLLDENRTTGGFGETLGSITTQLAGLFYSDIGESICGSQYRLLVSLCFFSLRFRGDRFCYG